MNKRPIIHLLNVAIFAAVAVPLFVLVGPKASAQNPSDLIGNDRYAQREAVRYEKFCRKDRTCLVEIKEAREKFMQMERRARPPGQRWRYGHGYVGPDLDAVRRSNEILASFKYARQASVRQVLDDYIVDYRNAVALADNGLWHLGYGHEDPCWLIGREYSEDGYYECYDNGARFFVFPNVNLLK